MNLAKKLFIATAVSSLFVTAAFAGNASLVKEGAKIFNTKKMGNCLACHAVNGKKINNPGSMGPTLTGLKDWPKQALYDKIYNPNKTNPVSQMPAFGINGWLSDHQIKALVAYLKTVK